MSEGRGGEKLTTNRLAGESSPYLRLHQHNPVDWYPWGPEALERARREDRPIFLSVGYSTCYWCHVMERESFSNPAIAERMNRDFVNVKLDREERPDLDEIYMAATQILSGHGGWPNSVFLTPQLRPFYAGTYFPPEDRHGRPGFPAVLAGLAESWAGRRPEVLEQAEEMARAMRHYLEERVQPAGVPPGPAAALRSFESLARRFDREHGGFGDAPKFPTPANLMLLLEVAGEAEEAGPMLAATLDAMARGGIYDQLGGGFHRYSTDREWRVPHFEKMLYDNGLLLEVYAREHARTGDPQAARIGRETAAFLAREMTAPEGAFWSAIDAETEGEEGAYYVWRREEIAGLLGEEDAAFLAPILGFAGPPSFEGGRYVLHLTQPVEELARQRRLAPEELLAEVRRLEDRLLAARDRRPRPATDDKILTDWNGTAITGLAVAGELLGEPELAARAARAADFVLTHLRPAIDGNPGPLHHAWREGGAKIPAFASDYAFLVRGLLALDRATGRESGAHPDRSRWLAAAVDLTREQMARLRDPLGGFFVAAESPDLLFRSHDVFDGALPAAEAVTVLNLVDLYEATKEEIWLAEARAALQAFTRLVERHPDAVRSLALAARRYHLAAGGGLEPVPDERAPDAGLRLMEEEAEEVVTFGLDLGEPGPDGFRPFLLTLAVAPGWHLNANPASEPFLVPTSLAGRGLELRGLRYPAGEPLAMGFEAKPLAAYTGCIDLAGELQGTGALLLTYQPCDATRCLPPIEREIAVS
jgi:uncharacterized protein YyaL (SSP411 family)